MPRSRRLYVLTLKCSLQWRFKERQNYLRTLAFQKVCVETRNVVHDRTHTHTHKVSVIPMRREARVRINESYQHLFPCISSVCVRSLDDFRFALRN